MYVYMMQMIVSTHSYYGPYRILICDLCKTTYMQRDSRCLAHLHARARPTQIFNPEYIYIYIYIYMHIHLYTYIYIYTHIYILHIHTHIYIYKYSIKNTLQTKKYSIKNTLQTDRPVREYNRKRDTN